MLSSYIHIKETWGVYAQKSLMFLILLMEKGQEVKKHSILVEVRSFRVPETFLMCIHKLSVKQQQCRIFSLPQQETPQSLLFFREFKPANWSLPWKTLPFCQVLLPRQNWPWLQRWEVGSTNRTDVEKQCLNNFLGKALKRKNFSWTKWPLVLAKVRKVKKTWDE